MDGSSRSSPRDFGISNMSHPTSRIQHPTSADAFEWTAGSVEETQQLGEQVGRLLQAGDVVALHGELGSGKTTFVQGLARGLQRDPETIKSPTFVLMREYPGPVPLVHLDGYRLEGPSSAAWLDVELIFSPQKITVIEWADRFESLLPEQYVEARLSHVSAHRRRIVLRPVGERARTIVTQLQTKMADIRLQPSGTGPTSEDETKAQGDEISGD